MRHKSVETTKLFEKNLRDRILEKLSEISPLTRKRVKRLVSTLAVAVALFGPDGGIDSQKIRGVLAQETIEDIRDNLVETGKDIVTWVSEKGIPAAKEGYSVASESVSDVVETATPVIEKAVQQVRSEVEQNVSPVIQGAVGNLFDFNIGTTTDGTNSVEGVVRSTQPTNKTVELRLSDLDDLELIESISPVIKKSNESDETNQDKIYPTVTPAKFGKEPEQSLRLINKEPELSLNRPFNFKETNDIVFELGLTAQDFLNPDYQKIKNFDSLTNPNVPLLKIFPEKVMEWSSIIEEECRNFNSLPENKGFEVSPNIALSILTVETFGNQFAQNRTSGASGGFQFMPVQFYQDYILSGEFDGGLGRLISYDEFAGDYRFRNGLDGGKPGLLHDKRYSTKLFIKYWSDMKRYNGEVYSKLGIDSPFQELVFQAGEYNGGQLNAINTYQEINRNYENTRYVRMIARIGIVAEIANDLIDKGYKEDYNIMLSSKLIENRILEAFEVKDAQNAGSYLSTKKILQLAGQKEFMAGTITRKLFLEEIPDFQPTTTPTEHNAPYTYFSNPAIDIIYDFEYNS